MHNFISQAIRTFDFNLTLKNEFRKVILFVKDNKNKSISGKRNWIAKLDKPEIAEQARYVTQTKFTWPWIKKKNSEDKEEEGKKAWEKET